MPQIHDLENGSLMLLWLVCITLQEEEQKRTEEERNAQCATAAVAPTVKVPIFIPFVLQPCVTHL